MVTMDHIDPAELSKQDSLAVVLAGFNCKLEDNDPHKIMGGVFDEDEEGNYHRHHLLLYQHHEDLRRINKNILEADLRHRGWAEEPEYEEVAVRGGKGQKGRTRPVRKPDSGVRHHCEIQVSHKYSLEDSKDERKGKKLGDFKATFPWNKMCDYVLDPAKDKKIDDVPFFFNCDENTIYIEDLLESSKLPFHPSLLEPENLVTLCQYAIKLKKDGLSKPQAIVELCKRCDNHPHMFWIAMRAYEAQEPQGGKFYYYI